MLILFEHTEYFKWEATDEGRRRNALHRESSSGAVNNSLVAFINVEEKDPGNAPTIRRAVRMIDSMAAELKVENVVLYPFAHLIPEGHATQDSAVEVLSILGRKVAETGSGYNVVSVPFGCSKMREAKVLGHDRAVLLRSIR